MEYDTGTPAGEFADPLIRLHRVAQTRIGERPAVCQLTSPAGHRGMTFR